jgi:hypothetical protein
MHRVVLALAVAGGVCFALQSAASAQTVWSGFDFSFEKVDFADETDSDNWDQITSNVSIIRGDSRGIYNPLEEGFWSEASPADTEWATDMNNPGDTIAATNFAALDFAPWIDAYGGQLSGELDTRLTSRNAVVHLITDDIYLDLRFTSWTVGSLNGGGFAYNRALPPADPETTGDYNLDGFVNAADYVHWRKTLDDPADPEGSGADGDGDGTIDDGDYDFWVAHFGETPMVGGGPSSPAVPEPAGCTLAVLLVMCGGAHRCRIG